MGCTGIVESMVERFSSVSSQCTIKFDGQKDLELSKALMHMCMSNLELLQRKKSCVQIGIDSVERNVYYMAKMSHNIKLISFLEKFQKVIM